MERSMEKVLRTAAFFVCLSLFFAQVKNIWVQFDDKETNTAISYTTFKSMYLPYITLCPKIPYKQEENLVDEDSYVSNAFSFDELFHEEFVQEVERGNWVVTERRNIYLGQCFTLRNTKTWSASDVLARVFIRANTSFYIFLHERNEEIFLKASLSPLPLDSLEYNARFGEVSFADVKIVKAIRSLYRRGDSCEEYPNDDQELMHSTFADCIAASTRRIFSASAKCRTPILNLELNNTSYDRLKPCVNETQAYQAKSVIVATHYKVSVDPKAMGCRMPCQRTVYSATMQYYHPFTSMVWSGSRYTSPWHQYNIIFFYYSTMVVETKHEVRVYDFVRLLSGLGGSLGLFLGFSLYSILKKGLDLWMSSSPRNRRDKRVKVTPHRRKPGFRH